MTRIIALLFIAAVSSATLVAGQDPLCTQGLVGPFGLAGACCPTMCGTCGGPGCDTRPGGPNNCCGVVIANSGISCDQNSAPCTIARDPDCRTGSVNLAEGICCAAACGTCGGVEGQGCESRFNVPFGQPTADRCCTANVRNSNRPCANFPPPCTLSAVQQQPPIPPPTPQVPAAKVVVLFEHGDYQGRSLSVDVGSYDWGFFLNNKFDDIASSAKIASGYKVTLCAHAGYVECQTYRNDVNWFGHLNDSFSSMIVLKDVVYLFEHGDYQGRSLSVDVGSYDWGFFLDNKFDDIASSAVIPSGYVVKLCVHPGFVECQTYSNNINWFGASNDSFSSMIVLKEVVVLFENGDYSGRRLSVDVGFYDHAFFASNNFDDKASSVKIQSGYSVKLCAHPGFVECQTYTNSINWFGASNDSFSSMIVSKI